MTLQSLSPDQFPVTEQMLTAMIDIGVIKSMVEINPS